MGMSSTGAGVGGVVLVSDAREEEIVLRSKLCVHESYSRVIVLHCVTDYDWKLMQW